MNYTIIEINNSNSFLVTPGNLGENKLSKWTNRNLYFFLDQDFDKLFLFFFFKYIYFQFMQLLYRKNNVLKSFRIEIIVLKFVLYCEHVIFNITS